jgi:hypothetical protein
MNTITWNGKEVPVRGHTPPRAIVEIRTGAPRGKAEVMRVLKYLGGGRYRMMVRFLHCPDYEYMREVNIDER